MNELLLPLRHLFEWVDAFPSSVALRESQYLHSWVTVAHVVTMAAFAGLIIVMDVRLLGTGHMQLPFSQVQRRLFPWQMVAFALSAATGLALLYAQPLRYFESIFFWLKIGTVGLTFLNALAFEFATAFSVDRWDTATRPPLGARLAGAVSLLLWTAVIVEGRMIPYSLTWFFKE
jgi:hypothetical protein